MKSAHSAGIDIFLHTRGNTPDGNSAVAGPGQGHQRRAHGTARRKSLHWRANDSNPRRQTMDKSEAIARHPADIGNDDITDGIMGQIPIVIPVVGALVIFLLALIAIVVG